MPTLVGNMFALVISAGAMEMRNTFIGQIPESRRVTGVGLTMGLSVGLFAYGGLWLDTQFGTKPPGNHSDACQSWGREPVD